MHISDLHRSKTNPINNQTLLSGLISDCERYTKESIPIPKPNAVVVSGDIVQGLSLGSTKYPDELHAQYSEALEFLNKMSEDFFNGDKTKMIVTPGNHDVDWNMARNAMVEIEIRDQNILDLITKPNSNYRWCWASRTLLRIEDKRKYEERFQIFNKFYEEFYKNTQLETQLDPKREWNLFTLNEGKIIIGAFNSCINNDCFNLGGNISLDAISESYLELLKNGLHQNLLISVWHHGIQGPPLKNDYIDRDALDLFLGRGYSLGLHGHEHKYGSFPHSLYFSNEETMSILSSGSLCSSYLELPYRWPRTYTLVVINDDFSSARVHIRQMISPGVFSPFRSDSTGGKSYVDVSWTKIPQLAAHGGGRPISILNEIEESISDDALDLAIKLIEENKSILTHHARPLLLDVLVKKQNWEKVLKEINSPKNSHEMTILFEACIAKKNWKRAQASLEQAKSNPKIDNKLIQNLIARLKIEKGLKKNE